MVKIFKGNGQYRLIHPNRLARKYSIGELTRMDCFVFQGNYPTADATEIELSNMSDHLPRIFSLGDQTNNEDNWLRALAAEISHTHSEAIVILDRK